MSPWFHGELGSVEAAKILRASGYTFSYLVRFSAREPGCFTLSRSVPTVKGEEVQHHRLYNTAKGITFGNNVFPTVGAFIKRAAGPLQLVNPVQPTPYQSLVKLWFSKLHSEAHCSKQNCGTYMRFRPSTQSNLNYSEHTKRHHSSRRKASFSAGEADNEVKLAAASAEHIGKRIAEIERNCIEERRVQRRTASEHSTMPTQSSVRYSKDDLVLPAINKS